MRYILFYTQSTCWSKDRCKPVEGGYGSYIASEDGFVMAIDPLQAFKWDDINIAHRAANKNTNAGDKYFTRVEEYL